MASDSMFLFSEHGDAKGELSILYSVKKSDRSPEEKARVTADMIACGKAYGFTFREYMRYDFEHLTKEQQYAFLSDKEHISICERLNNPEVHALLDDKYATFLRFRPYFKRESMLVTQETAKDLPSFLEKTGRIIGKPCDDWGGNGVFAAAATDSGTAVETAAALVASHPGGFVAEERLSNAGILYDVHPASLNTLRVSTIRIGDDVKVIHPRVRIGCGGSVVDNISLGGFQGAIDVETGKVYRVCDSFGQPADVHPDTGVHMLGMEIPQWEEAKAMTEALARELDGLHYCGWDIAFTDRGWVMVEGNDWGQFGWQAVEQKGCRREFEEYLAAIGV